MNITDQSVTRPTLTSALAKERRGVPRWAASMSNTGRGLQYPNGAYREIVKSAELTAAEVKLRQLMATLESSLDLDPTSRSIIENNITHARHMVSVYRKQVFDAYGLVEDANGAMKIVAHWHETRFGTMPWPPR